MTENKVCECCGRTFQTNRRNARFCSIRCQKTAKCRRQRARISDARAEARAHLRCENCGREFAAGQRRQRFCSVKCQKAAWYRAHGVNVSPVCAVECCVDDAAEKRVRAYLSLPPEERWRRAENFLRRT